MHPSVRARLIILQGGEEVEKRTNKSLIRKVGHLSATKRILVIPWTTESVERELKFRTILRDYFSDSGFRDVLFLEKMDTKEETSMKLSAVDVVYLPGGDPDLLYRELKSRSLQDGLREFRGIIMANSAGAIVLSKGMQGVKGFRDGTSHPGLGLVDFFVAVHYKPEEFSYGHDQGPVVNIPENEWVTIVHGRMTKSFRG